jgi:hypothetical protein
MSEPANKRFQWQLDLRPVRNQAVTSEPLADGKSRLSVPLAHRRWSRLLQQVLPLRNAKDVELDELGTELLSWCDGETTFETMIGRYQQRWNLSFFEARSLLIQFFQSLLRRNIIVVAADSPGEPGT